MTAPAFVNLLDVPCPGCSAAPGQGCQVCPPWSPLDGICERQRVQAERLDRKAQKK